MIFGFKKVDFREIFGKSGMLALLGTLLFESGDVNGTWLRRLVCGGKVVLHMF